MLSPSFFHPKARLTFAEKPGKKPRRRRNFKILGQGDEALCPYSPRRPYTLMTKAIYLIFLILQRV